MRDPRVSLSVLALLVSFTAALPTWAIDPGYDILETVSASIEFGTSEVPAIPADFFGPGSDPFVGQVELTSFPSGSAPCATFVTYDTAVSRLGTANVPLPGNSDTVPVEIVALSLQSAQPITVTSNGGQNPTQWQVVVRLPVGPPQSSGQMDIQRTSSEGGTYDVQVPLVPEIEFIPVLPGSPLVFTWPTAPLTIEITGATWFDPFGNPGDCDEQFSSFASRAFSTPGGAFSGVLKDAGFVDDTILGSVGTGWAAVLLAGALGLVAWRFRRRTLSGTLR